MKTKLTLLFVLILLCMLVVTSWATWQENIFSGGAKLLAQPWGVATLADAYFGFLTFYVWVHYKEEAWLKRIIWFAAIMLLGNIGMSVYVLWQIKKSAGSGIESILLRARVSRAA